MITENGINLIKFFEGLKLKSYKCPAGVYTVGYGHTLTANINQIITEEQANELLNMDLKVSEQKVKYYLQHNKMIPQSHLDCFISLAFNLTTKSLRKLIEYYIIDVEMFKKKLLLYDKDIKGKQHLGLTRRRNAELMLFNGMSWGEILKYEKNNFIKSEG